jgi:membrane-associated protein
MTAALTALLSSLGPLAVVALAAVIFAETGLLIGFFLPGDSILFASGLLVASGAIPVPLFVVIAVTWAAAALGDQVAFWIGRRFGPQVLAGRGGRWIPARHVEGSRAFFERHGPKAVILARFVPLARTFTPVVAGAVGMPRRRFTAYNLVGGLGWTSAMCLAGHWLGQVPVVAAHVDVFTVGIVVISVTPGAIALLWRRRRGSASTSSDADAHSGDLERPSVVAAAGGESTSRARTPQDT